MSTRDFRRFPSRPKRTLFDWLAKALVLSLIVGVSFGTLASKPPAHVAAASR